MINFKLKYLIIFLFIIVEGHAQKKQALLVFFKDKDLSSLISNVISENNTCEKGIWYAEIMDTSNILLSKSYLSNLIELSSLKENDLYMTTINNRIIFVISERRYDDLFQKTFFNLDLPTFSDLDFVYFYDFSYWHFQKMEDKFDVVEEKIYKCK